MMSFSFQKYFDVITALLSDPGCAWSKKQTLSTICSHVIEETYEVLDAAKSGDRDKVLEELGDLLFGVSFLMTLSLKKYGASFDQVVEKGANKIIRRSPHVFENPQELSLEQLREQWEQLKAKERTEKKENPIDSVASSLPHLTRGTKWAELAFKYGFEPSFDPNNLGDALLKQVFEGVNRLENVSHAFEESLGKFEGEFKKWLEIEKPEVMSS
jgi:ATP diphosphatase